MNFDSHLYLLHAFDLLGRRLHGARWNGQEYRAAKRQPPDDVSAARAPFERSIADLDRRQAAIAEARRRTVAADEIARLADEERAVIAERQSLRNQLRELPEPDDSYATAWQAYSRRLETERLLVDALRSGKLQVQFPSGTVVDWPYWERDAGFKLFLELSMVKVPRHRSGAGRGSVLFRRDAFEEWLKTVLPYDEGDQAQLPPEERCRAWLVDLVGKMQKPGRKEALRSEAMVRFPGLSKRAFDRIWEKHTPSNWRTAGRRPDN